MTPARQLREQQKHKALQEKINEEKYLEFKMACSDGDADGCHSLAEWFSVIRADFVQAAQLYRPNCDTRNHASSCLNLGILSCKCVVYEKIDC